jgi:microcystin degradation protein MlrC
MDGLLLALHGAMVAEPYPDADGETLVRLRRLFGREFPIICTLDIHANVSPRMVENATALIIYRSNPHLDQRARGLEAAQLMVRTVKGEVKPVMAAEFPPLVINILRQYTGQEPAASLIRDLEVVLGYTKILSASVAEGYPYADVEEMGMSFLTVADDDIALARQAARWMATRAWDQRQSFIGKAPAPAEALRRAADVPQRPIVLMDVGDNVGGGSAGDSTFLLEEALRQGIGNMLVILYDPESVQACVRAGVGATVTLRVGGKTDTLHGRPIAIQGKVRILSDGKYTEDEVRHGGRRSYDMGTAAVVETEQAHTIILTSMREIPVSLGQVLSVGVRPHRKKIIVAKGVVSPRPAYEPIAAEVVLVNTPGSTTADLSKFDYKRRRKPLFPFETDVAYAPSEQSETRS